MSKKSISRAFNVLIVTLFLMVMVQSCEQQRNILAYDYENQRIPVQSLDGTALGFASLTFHDDVIRYKNIIFKKFSLTFDNPKIHEWLNMENKYWHGAADVVLIVSQIPNERTSKSDIKIDTLIDSKLSSKGEVYNFEAAFYGFSWQSKRLPNKVDPDTGETLYLLKIEDTGYPYPGAKCIFSFDIDLDIVAINVEELDLSKGYR